MAKQRIEDPAHLVVLQRLLDILADARKGPPGAGGGASHGAPALVALAGPQALGKTATAKALADLGHEREPPLRVEVLPADSFLLDRSIRRARRLSGAHPEAVDEAALVRAVTAAARGEQVVYRPFDHRTGSHAGPRTIPRGHDVLLVEGIHALHPSIAGLMDLRVVFRADPYDLVRFRIHADIERGYPKAEAEPHAAFEVAGFRRHIGDQTAEADWIVEVGPEWTYALVGGPGRRG